MKPLLSILLLLMPLAALSQKRLTGVVTDGGGEPLTGAIVQLRHSESGRMIRFGRTDAKGAFSMEAAMGSYLEVAMLGYKKQRIDNPSAEKPLRIVMQEETVALKEVTVKASKVREHGDTLTYHVGAYADRNDRSIGDVLARIPGFEVNKQNGQIKYEGKPISKFYIEGLDMLGGKYGVATNSLPQADVGSVQVMRNHQPIRVLEDFTYTDDAAVNIRMKESAKNRWVTSFGAGGGIGQDGGLWRLEAFGLRLGSAFQTMLTYKTNNTGQNISKETTSLFSLDELESQSDYIRLAPPTTPNLAERRTLQNRSHAVTANTMKRLSESAQVNVQIIYNNDRQTAQGERQTAYFLPDGTRTIDHRKDWLQKDNELYALVKYEKNSTRQYLKNSLSGDFAWSCQWLDEFGTASHHQFASKPEYDIKDNLYIIRKYAGSLVSFYSNNRIVSRPQSLSVDSLYQHVGQQRYSTNTYVMGGTKLGRFSLSLKTGVNASLHRLESDLEGLDLAAGNFSLFTLHSSLFTLARFYAEPRLTYKTRDINIELAPTAEYLYEKYSEDKAHRQMLLSPDLSIRWYVTPRLRLSLGGYSTVEPADPSRFYSALILQDFQYTNRGWTGYRHSHRWSVRGGLAYNDALHGLHTILSVSRSFTTSPYTPTRLFVGDYIIISATEQETTSAAWTANLIASKGIGLWNGVVSLRAFYTDSHSTMLQNDQPTGYDSRMLNASTGIDLSFWKDMRLRYELALRYSQMKTEQTDTSISNWHHQLTLTIPAKPFTFDLAAERYRNEIAPDSYKDFFLADLKATCKLRHADLTLALSNLLNHCTYAYVATSDLMRHAYTNRIRGRELMASFYYRP